MVSATTDRPSTVTPQPPPAALMARATSVSQGVRTAASWRRNQVLARSPRLSHGVCAENRNAQATITTASTSQDVVLTVNGFGSGGGVPVGRRCRAVRGPGAGGPGAGGPGAGGAAAGAGRAGAGAPVGSVFSFTGTQPSREEPLGSRVRRQAPLPMMPLPSRVG